MMRFTLMMGLLLVMVMGLVGCAVEAVAPDYTVSTLEEALNAGEVVDGKTVLLEVGELVPDSAFGYNMQAGEHLNFVSVENPIVKTGDTVTIRVTKVASVFGSWIITYEIVE